MDRLFFCIILIILFVVHFYNLIRENRKNGRVGAFSAVMLTCIIYYDLYPLLVYSWGNENDLTVNQLEIRGANVLNFLFAELCIIVFTLFFYFAYHRYNNRAKREVYTYDQAKFVRICAWMSHFTFFIGATTFIAYIYAFGGIGSLLAKAEYLRSFATSGAEFVSRFQSILVVPARMITVTPVVSFPLTTKDFSVNYKFIYKLEFCLSLLLSIVFLLTNAGKAPIIVFSICFIMPILKKFFKHPWRMVFLFSFFSLPILDYMDELFVWLQKGFWVQSTRSSIEILDQFGYIYQNNLYLQEIVAQYGIRWCQDFITGFLNVVPGITKFPPSYIVTSEFFNGVNWMYIGGRPVDIITFGYLELGLLGVILMAILFGIICGYQSILEHR